MAEISCIDCGEPVTHQCDICAELICANHMEKVHEVVTGTHWEICKDCYKIKFGEK